MIVAKCVVAVEFNEKSAKTHGILGVFMHLPANWERSDIILNSGNEMTEIEMI